MTFTSFRCPGCGYEVAEIDHATMDNDDCPACGAVPVVEFEVVPAAIVAAEKRREKT